MEEKEIPNVIAENSDKDFKLKCEFNKKGYCKISGCDVECDFRSIEFNEVSLRNKIAEERVNIRVLVLKIKNAKSLITYALRFKDSPPKITDPKKSEVMDKIMGISMMFKILENDFGIENKYKGKTFVLVKDIIEDKI